MNEIPSFPCGKHEAYYIDQCEAWVNEHWSQLGMDNPYGMPIRSEDIDDTQYIEFQHNLQAQLMTVTSSDTCPISCRCDYCPLEEVINAEEYEATYDDVLEQEEEQDVLEMTDCKRFIDQCEREYNG